MRDGACWNRGLPWVAVAQVGDALAHGQWGFANGASSDRLAGLAAVAAPEAEDEEVAQLVFLILDSAEGRADPELLAELGPLAEDLVLGLAVLDTVVVLSVQIRRAALRSALKRSAASSGAAARVFPVDSSGRSVRGRRCQKDVAGERRRRP